MVNAVVLNKSKAITNNL